MPLGTYDVPGVPAVVLVTEVAGMIAVEGAVVSEATHWSGNWRCVTGRPGSVTTPGLVRKSA